MKRYIILFLFALSVYSRAQTPSWLWAKEAGGSAWDKAYSIASDNAGNLYVTGYSASPVMIFGSDTLINSGLSMYLVKYDNVGNVIWIRGATGSSTGANIGNAVAVDNVGNVYVAGWSSIYNFTSITFGSFTLTHDGMFLVKYDSSGNVIWARDAVNAGASATAVAVDNLGNIFVGGQVPGAGSPNPDSLFIGQDTITNYYDKFVAKYDTAGNPIWARGLYVGGTTYDEASVEDPFITTDKFGNLYITGGFWVNPCIISTTTLINQGFHNIYLAKFNGAGNLQWAKRYGGSGHDDGTSIATDTLGNVYITGYFDDSNITFAPLTISAGLNVHIYIVKLNPAGNAIWVNKVKYLNSEYPIKIITDKNQEVYIAGYWGGPYNLIFSPTDSLVNKGLFLAKYDINGNFKWARDAVRIGGLVVNRATSLCIDDVGNPYITGYFGDTLIFDATMLIDTAAPFNIFVAAMGTTTSVVENNLIQENGFSVFPNPSHNTFAIESQLQNAQLKIYDLTGREVFITTLNSKLQTLNPNLSSGVYFVKVTDGEKVFTQKLVIQ